MRHLGHNRSDACGHDSPRFCFWQSLVGFKIAVETAGLKIALGGSDGAAEEDEGEDGAANDAKDVAGREGHGGFLRYMDEWEWGDESGMSVSLKGDLTLGIFDDVLEAKV